MTTKFDLIKCLNNYFLLCSPKQMTEEEFSKECYRCGRRIDKPGEHIWRWKTFYYGLDLVMTLDTTSLRIERSHRVDSEQILANHKEHRILIK